MKLDAAVGDKLRVSHTSKFHAAYIFEAFLQLFRGCFRSLRLPSDSGSEKRLHCMVYPPLSGTSVATIT